MVIQFGTLYAGNFQGFDQLKAYVQNAINVSTSEDYLCKNHFFLDDNQSNRISTSKRDQLSCLPVGAEAESVGWEWYNWMLICFN